MRVTDEIPLDMLTELAGVGKSMVGVHKLLLLQDVTDPGTSIHLDAGSGSYATGSVQSITNLFNSVFHITHRGRFIDPTLISMIINHQGYSKFKSSWWYVEFRGCANAQDMLNMLCLVALDARKREWEKPRPDSVLQGVTNDG